MEGQKEEEGYLDIVKLLIKHNAHLAGKTLCIACSEANIKIVEYLLSCGLSPDNNSDGMVICNKHNNINLHIYHYRRE